MISREIAPTHIYHIYSRGTLKMEIFREAKDYERFLLRVMEYRLRYPVEILAYCLMPNHFHILMREPEESVAKNVANISNFLRILLNSYAKYFCIKYRHSGNVFQGKFQSKLIDSESYFMQIIDYIHQNPVRKGLINDVSKWPYSSLTRQI